MRGNPSGAVEKRRRRGLGSGQAARSLGGEHGPILLGLVDSGQWRRRHAAQAAEGESFAEWSARLAKDKSIPLGRLGRPEEAARAIAFLASPWSSYTTGGVIDVSGGVSRHA